MILEVFIKGNIYLMRAKRINGKVKLFFKTDSHYYNSFGFDLPLYCCDNIQHKWKNWNNFKNDLFNKTYKDIELFPEE